MSSIEHHAYADLFPMTSDSGLAELAADIAAHGLREPIALLDGRILDGRARYRSCRLAGVEPRFKPFDGADPFGFVVARNLARHNLSYDQRAMIAAEAVALSGAAAGDRPKAKRRPAKKAKARKAPGKPSTQPTPKRTVLRRQYAELNGLIESTAECMKRIARSSQGFHQHVEDGVLRRLRFIQLRMLEYRRLYVDRPAATPTEIIAGRNERAAVWMQDRCARCVKSRKRLAYFETEMDGSK